MTPKNTNAKINWGEFQMQKTFFNLQVVTATIGIAFAVPVFAQENENRWSFSIEPSIRYDDNIGLGPDNPDELQGGNRRVRFDDLTTRIEGTIGLTVAQEAQHEFLVSATPFYERVDDLDGLSNFGITLGALYRGEFGPQFTDPWFSAKAEYTVIEFDDSRVRDGDWLEFEVTLGKRFSPAFGMSIGGRYFTRSQSETDGLCPGRADPNCPGSPTNLWRPGEVFEHEKAGGFLHADYFFGGKTQLFAEYSFWDGDAASTGAFLFGGSAPAGPNGDNISADDVAFPLYTLPNGNDTWYRVWRVDTTQHVVELGVSHALTDNLTLQFAIVHLETSDVKGPENGNSLDNYRNDAFELGVTITF